MLRTRFAPSPTGLLHVGNAYSALKVREWAERHHAEMLLRIEDIDSGRSRKLFEQGIIDDLAWLGIRWHGPVSRQSERLNLYCDALERLKSMGVIYPCFCTRRHIREEIERMGAAPHAEEGADPYPGICRDIAPHTASERMRHERFAWRFDLGKAIQAVGEPLFWRDGEGRTHPVYAAAHGDTVIGRKDIDFSYHLAVVVDDGDQGITHVIRGEDLMPVTGIHRLLQALLGLPDPVYIHHGLLRDTSGERLAKRHGSSTLQGLREAGADPERLADFLLKSAAATWPDTPPAELFGGLQS